MVKDSITKGNIVTVVIFSNAESSYGGSDSGNDYFEELLKNNKEIKIDYSNVSDGKKN